MNKQRKNTGLKDRALRARPAFTLLEMIIAITVFTIFIGFAISTYLSFHRADQEALEERSLMLEIQGSMDTLSEAVRNNTIDYTAPLEANTLHLLSPDGLTQTVYTWEEKEGTLSVQLFNAAGEVLAGYSNPVLLHGENTKVTYASFRVFPELNPYDEANASNDDVQYQPTVQIKLKFSVPGRVRPTVDLDLQTSVTSRFYQ